MFSNERTPCKRLLEGNIESTSNARGALGAEGGGSWYAFGADGAALGAVIASAGGAGLSSTAGFTSSTIGAGSVFEAGLLSLDVLGAEEDAAAAVEVGMTEKLKAGTGGA